MGAKVTKVYEQDVRVRVSSESCLDMMRYDRCCPKTEEDAHKLARIFNDVRWNDEDRVVTFRRFSLNPDRGPTEARWRSFGCVEGARTSDLAPTYSVKGASDAL